MEISDDVPWRFARACRVRRWRGQCRGKNGGSNGGGDTAAAAEQIFKQNCASCHGQDLSGGVGPNLQKVGSKYSKDQIKDIIANGRGAMPAGIIKGEDADKVAEWLAAKK